jgi:hypothetical protein
MAWGRSSIPASSGGTPIVALLPNVAFNVRFALNVAAYLVAAIHESPELQAFPTIPRRLSTPTLGKEKFTARR